MNVDPSLRRDSTESKGKIAKRLLHLAQSGHLSISLLDAKSKLTAVSTDWVRLMEAHAQGKAENDQLKKVIAALRER